MRSVLLVHRVLLGQLVRRAKPVRLARRVLQARKVPLARLAHKVCKVPRATRVTLVVALSSKAPCRQVLPPPLRLLLGICGLPTVTLLVGLLQLLVTAYCGAAQLGLMSDPSVVRRAPRVFKVFLASLARKVFKAQQERLVLLAQRVQLGPQVRKVPLVLLVQLVRPAPLARLARKVSKVSKV